MPPIGKHYSPLRYPGSKRQLLPWLTELLRLNEPLPETFVEPFAGGASVSLYVATAGLAERVVIGDADEMLYSFWRTACFDTQWLVDAMWNVDVTLSRWEHFRSSTSSSHRDRALACLFLNRTSFSGILHSWAGPIGGKSQSGLNAIDCRFPKTTLDERLLHVGKLAADGKIAAVRGTTYATTVRWAQKAWPDDVFAYLDPPFWAKAKKLYRRSFVRRDHQRLAKWTSELECRWLLSYDEARDVAELYRDLGVTPHMVELGYLAAPGRRSVRELVMSSEVNLPKSTKPFREVEP